MIGAIGPAGGLGGVFVASFLAATVVPFSSEAVLYGFLALHPDWEGAAVAVATVGNTLGGMTTYGLGRLVPARTRDRLDPRALRWLERYGPIATAASFLPLIGDALALGAGWLRLNWLLVLVAMIVGRLGRYLLVAAL